MRAFLYYILFRSPPRMYIVTSLNGKIFYKITDMGLANFLLCMPKKREPTEKMFLGFIINIKLIICYD